METELRVLMLEDSEEDTQLVIREFKKGGYAVSYQRVDTPEDLKKAIEKQAWDIIIADYTMPRFSGLDALRIVREKGIEIPFIIVSGTIGEDIAVQSMKAGVHDYIMKNNLARLIPAVRRELEEAEIRRQRKAEEEGRIRRDYQLEILARTSMHVNAVLSTPVIMQTLIGAAVELVHASSGTAGIFVGGKMKFREFNSKGKLVPIDYESESGGEIPGWLPGQRMRPVIVNDVKKTMDVMPSMAKKFGIYNLVSVPISDHKGELLGCFEIANKEERRHFDEQDVFMLQGLAANAAVALQNARMLEERKVAEKKLETLYFKLLQSTRRLKKISLKDPQTGLYNHRYLSEIIEAEFYRAKRYNHPLSVIMLDIDYFKSINDTYGHKFGDMVLKQFAICLKKTVRQCDMVVRFGGEEFVILAPNAERGKALVLSQRILVAVNKCVFGNKKNTVEIRFSIGMASYPDGAVSKAMDLITLADKALDMVKESGGNKIYTCADIKGEANHPSFRAVSKDVDFLTKRINKLVKRGKQDVVESIFAFAKTLELRDYYTGKHVEQTEYYSTAIANALALSPEDVERIKEASVLHDLGKIGISDKILHKKSRLSRKEFEEIKKHPMIGADIIRPIRFMHDIIPLILYHHERWDGSGYPDGLKGEEIPLGARIIALADVFQALTSNRPYRKAFSKKKALGIIKKEAGKQFDPNIVDLFLAIAAKSRKRE